MNLLVTPRLRLRFYDDRAFSVCAPKLWNNLPENVKCSPNLTSFKSNLKTYLFITGLLILGDGAILHNRPQIASDRTIHEKSHNSQKNAQNS